MAGKEGGDFRKLIGQICEVVQGPVSAEVVATEAAKMIVEGKDLASISEHVVVKCPTTPEGVKACSKLVESGIRVNMTLVFQPIQALIVAKAGATYVSPFLGRLDDIGQDSMELLETCREIYDNYEFETQILRGQPAPSAPRRTGRADRRRRRDAPARALRQAAGPSPHRQRARTVPGGLEKSQGPEDLQRIGVVVLLIKPRRCVE